MFFTTKECNITDYCSNTATSYNHNRLCGIQTHMRIDENGLDNPKEFLKHIMLPPYLNNQIASRTIQMQEMTLLTRLLEVILFKAHPIANVDTILVIPLQIFILVEIELIFAVKNFLNIPDFMEILLSIKENGVERLLIFPPQ